MANDNTDSAAAEDTSVAESEVREALAVWRGAEEAGDTLDDSSDDQASEANGADDPPAADDWRASIQDEKLRDHAGRFTTAQELAKAHLDLRKELSTAIKPLGKNPTDEQVAEYRTAIGVPKTVEGYELALPEGYEQTDADKAFQTAAAKAFHDTNITADQAKGLNGFWNEFTAAMLKAQIDADKAYADETEKALKAEWPGKEFDRNKAFADRAAAKVFGDEFDDVSKIETKDGRFVLDHPAFVKMLAGVGREMDEGRLGAVLTEGDRDNVQGQIDELGKKIDTARNEGDGEKANKLYIAQQELYRKIHGSASIVGSEGRTA